MLWHPSARIDYQLFLTNFGIKFLLRGAQTPFVVATSATVATILNLGFGAAEHGASPSDVMVIFWYSLGAFLVDDLSRFLLHYLQHNNAFLWRFHRVHHSAEVLTPITLYRFHPIETLCFSIRHVLTFGIYSGVCQYFFPDQIYGIRILGVDMFGFAFNMLLANLRHSQVWIHFGLLEHFIISPAQHQIHHSSNPDHFGKNLGTCLSIWDKFCGTQIRAPNLKSSKLSYGLGEQNPHTSLLKAILEPIPKSKNSKEITSHGA